MPGAASARPCADGSAARARASDGVVERRRRGIADQGRDMSHAMRVRPDSVRDKRAVLIAGPTASGKSALALALAERLGGIDRQCRLHAGLSRPAHPHRAADAGGRGAGAASALRPCRCRRELFGRPLAAPMRARRSTTVAARRPVADPGRRHRALLQGADAGLAAVPPIPPRSAPRCARGCGARAPRRCMPNSRGAIRRWRARLKPGDRTRIARALEVLEATGRSLADWHRDGMPAIARSRRRADGFPRRRPRRAAPPDRRALRRHAGGRRARGGAGARRARSRSAAAGHEGARRALAAAASRRRDHAGRGRRGGKTDTRRYTKRQVTWFRHQMPGWVWLELARCREGRFGRAWFCEQKWLDRRIRRSV